MEAHEARIFQDLSALGINSGSVLPVNLTSRDSKFQILESNLALDFIDDRGD
jgi:hypothetical protein